MSQQMTNEQVIKAYVRAMEARIEHHALDFFGMWSKYLRPELESGHWTACPRKERKHRYGISANFFAHNGNVLVCRYEGRKLHLRNGSRESAFSPRQGRAALRFVRQVRGA